MGGFQQNLVLTTGMLVLKMMICHLLTIRARFMRTQFKTKEDNQFGPGGSLKWLGDVFRVLLCGFGPELPLERLLGIVQNSIENEPFFFAAAFMLGSYKSPSGSMGDAVLYYGIARCLHAFFYLAKLQPFRAIAYTTGVSITLWFAVTLVL